MADPHETSAVHGFAMSMWSASGGFALVGLYVALMVYRHRKAPATGAVVRLFLESWVAIGSVLLAVRMLNGYSIGQQFEDYFYIYLGLLAAIVVSVKHAFGMFGSIFKRKDPNWEPRTDNADH